MAGECLFLLVALGGVAIADHHDFSDDQGYGVPPFAGWHHSLASLTKHLKHGPPFLKLHRHQHDIIPIARPPRMFPRHMFHTHIKDLPRREDELTANHVHKSQSRTSFTDSHGNHVELGNQLVLRGEKDHRFGQSGASPEWNMHGRQLKYKKVAQEKQPFYSTEPMYENNNSENIPRKFARLFQHKRNDKQNIMANPDHGKTSSRNKSSGMRRNNKQNQLRGKRNFKKHDDKKKKNLIVKYTYGEYGPRHEHHHDGPRCHHYGCPVHEEYEVIEEVEEYEEKVAKVPYYYGYGYYKYGYDDYDYY